MTYRVILSNAAERDLRGIRDTSVARRLVNAIDALADDPMPPGSGKLRGHRDVWRIRVGAWRICYAIEGDRLIVLILTVAQRGSVYDRLRRRLG